MTTLKQITPMCVEMSELTEELAESVQKGQILLVLAKDELTGEDLLCFSLLDLEDQKLPADSVSIGNGMLEGGSFKFDAKNGLVHHNPLINFAASFVFGKDGQHYESVDSVLQKMKEKLQNPNLTIFVVPQKKKREQKHQQEE